ncbi:metallophosphoesterase family protein [Pseudoalteromonas sp. T1lg88]|uniref:metallophosphoesterase family protein n=1 Tax=Pseudoalteromonas sp. T1lg88 TaxID=2077104 RepID=UPI000CF6AD4F|nr:metallophosphoesterase [Pseudoalteromonas sp. T1lg88]
MTKLALRFRDLVTPPDGTINIHKEMIEDNGFVYWGWWCKAGEKCPSKFNDFQELLAKGEQEIFLFDSGQNKLFRAQLSAIRFDNAPLGIECPEPDYTPSYYRERSFKAWFKLTSIDEIGNASVKDELNQFSYEDNNYGLFKESEPFKDFFNKRVISPDELRHQDRTIWFLTDYVASEHDSHEILLYNNNSVNPSVFPKNHSKVYTSKLHWMTDLHFSDGDNQHGFDNRLQDQSLERLIEDKFKEQIQALIVSGDMTWRASASEFKKTSDFYEYLCSNTKLSFDKIGFCPGNHDLAYNGELTEEQKSALEKYQMLQRGEENAPHRLSQQEIDNLRAIENSEVSVAAYEAHFEAVASTAPNQYLSMGKKFLVNQQRSVDICFLNSNRMQQYKDLFQGNGLIGEDQRVDAAKEMGWTIPKAYGTIRIVVVHHNLLPVEYSNTPYLGSSPGSYVYDSQATIKWCYEHDVDVILHGHTHQRSVVKLEDHTSVDRKSVWLVGLGSTSAHHTHLIPGHLNQLAELDFSNKNIAIQFYTINENRVTEDGNPIILE